MIKKNKVIIIAEIGLVLDGSLGQAKNLITEAARCSAEAVKIQTHIADEETLIYAPSPKYFNSENRHNYFKRTAINYDQIKELFFFSKKFGIQFFSSPFSIAAFELLVFRIYFKI